MLEKVVKWYNMPLLRLSYMYWLIHFNLLKCKLKKILNIVKCSRSVEFEKQTDQNFITQNLIHGEEYCIS